MRHMHHARVRAQCHRCRMRMQKLLHVSGATLPSRRVLKQVAGHYAALVNGDSSGM
jgi:hypothetical protein